MAKYNRIAVFAHYDKDNLIDDYVVYYLKELKSVVSKIIFVSDGFVSDHEISKISSLVDISIAEPHGEYDFGSYKRGFQYLKKNGFLNELEELIFANDSCFGPIFPLEKIFDTMAAKSLDAWGITQNKFSFMPFSEGYLPIVRPHFQSYFFVLAKSVFLSREFEMFISSVVAEDKKIDVILKYEVGLTQLVETLGLDWGSYLNVFSSVNVAYLHKWRQLIVSHSMPFLKRSLLLNRRNDFEMKINYEEIISSVSDYPVEFIDSYLARKSLGLQPKVNFVSAFLKKIIRHIYFNFGSKIVAIFANKK